MAKRRCWLWHRWQVVGERGPDRYEECKDCGLRRVRKFKMVESPIDKDWLSGRKETLDD